MQRLDDFRIFYNHTIHPELMRMERRRKRLLWLLFGLSLLIIGLIVLEFYINIVSFILFLMIPIGLIIVYLLFLIQQYRDNFKPRVVELILDFIDDSVNYGTLTYQPHAFIPKDTFYKSMIFASAAPQYQGEDLISGKIGELDFELCELNVREYSRVRSRLNYVFRGVFLHSETKRPLTGKMLILPKAFRQYLTRTVREFIQVKGQKVESSNEFFIEGFEDHFSTYATADVFMRELLPFDLQERLVDFKLTTGKEIYLSFIEQNIYIAVTEPKNLLEPFIFQSNVSFDLVKEFFEDIYTLVSIVEDIDNSH